MQNILFVLTHLKKIEIFLPLDTKELDMEQKVRSKTEQILIVILGSIKNILIFLQYFSIKLIS